METTIVALGAGGFVALLVLALLVVLLARRARRDRAELESLLAAARRDADDLRRRLEELSARLEPAPVPDTADFVITSAGEPEPATPSVSDRLVLSATVGEPLVKAAAFTYGVRRALSPASRNRIWFEMRREVRASRKRRRRLVKEFLRDVRAQERAQETVA